MPDINSDSVIQIAPLGVLERLSSKLDLPWIVMEINLSGKKKTEQHKLIAQIENEMASIGYEGSREFSSREKDGSYHLHFLRSSPNA